MYKNIELYFLCLSLPMGHGGCFIHENIVIIYMKVDFIGYMHLISTGRAHCELDTSKMSECYFLFTINKFQCKVCRRHE